jgi:hypothetical protein
MSLLLAASVPCCAGYVVLLCSALLCSALLCLGCVGILASVEASSRRAHSLRPSQSVHQASAHQRRDIRSRQSDCSGSKVRDGAFWARTACDVDMLVVDVCCCWCCCCCCHCFFSLILPLSATATVASAAAGVGCCFLRRTHALSFHGAAAADVARAPVSCFLSLGRMWALQAFLQRGNLRLLYGDCDLARQDYERVLQCVVCRCRCRCRAVVGVLCTAVAVAVTMWSACCVMRV